VTRRAGRPTKYVDGHVVLAVRIDVELADRLQQQIERRGGVTKNYLIERAVEQYVGKLEKQKVVPLP
jgi:predicted DNA-binding protein